VKILSLRLRRQWAIFYWKPVAAPTNVVAEFRLSRKARADLLDILTFTEAKFGAYQGRRITLDLSARLDCSLTFLL
jgi:hypothetical protein